MDHERWNRIGEILADALELPPSERSDFLAERCGPDEDLRAEVEELLLASEEEGLLPADPEPEPPDLVGTTIAHYRVEALIGVGGMGRVYRGVDT
ncbi:MAG: serine/threonine protein kinase, partial [Gemmatimonadetes bacterium]|nr:serine/threonine protein kinase [Gemmatimonadota bacterium]NIR78634.1 serine/threonine protein kinase [Gemmatimonadota bacterium]NIT87252.1 serine/threonine protein kinase [Gemmatimonadota bacterium]NIU31095.1 serine/threonine protein kinase [Gemmatimonadota bacterium]NIU35831.1 serine/threonine protein kinase [Gemmatimonadota bacterium]